MRLLGVGVLAMLGHLPENTQKTGLSLQNAAISALFFNL